MLNSSLGREYVYLYPIWRIIVLPVFNIGQAILLGTILLALLAYGFTSDDGLFLFLAIGAYCGVVATSMLLGTVPAEACVESSDVGRIRQLLDSSENLTPLGSDTWAPRGFESQLWSSDRIALVPTATKDAFRLRGRVRDLRLILGSRRLGHALDVE